MSNLDSKTKVIISVVISLFLLGILLPVGITEITSVDLEDKVATSTYSNQSTNSSRNTSLIYSAQNINITIEYTDTIYLLNLSLELTDGTVLANDSTANQSLNVNFNATSNAIHTINVNNIGGYGSPEFNMTVVITTYLDSSLENTLETLITIIIPVMVVIAIILWYVKMKKDE